jgi:alkanesulfonate monooxygenase SsuD/methylene tetrahydromethanopterin reductase-like flavin-dependent oxidoreductase (luciferase family)
VTIQAGGSPSGLELAARTADVVFSVVQELESAKAAYADLKGRLVKYGRTPGPGLRAARSHADHRSHRCRGEGAKLSRLQSFLSPTNALVLVSSRLGYDVSGHPLDGPVPAPPLGEGTRTFSRVLYETARRENMTFARFIQPDGGGARPLGAVRYTAAHRRHAGENGSSPERRTDSTFCRHTFPARFDHFVDLVVPELQRRGLFRHDYEGTTLRDLFGLPRVEAARRPATAV